MDRDALRVSGSCPVEGVRGCGEGQRGQTGQETDVHALGPNGLGFLEGGGW